MDRASQQVVLLLILLLFYCVPHWLVLILSIKAILGLSGVISEGPLLSVVREVSTKPGAYTNIVHQMILPVVAAITATNYTAISMQRFALWVFVIPLITIFVCIVNALLFNVRVEDIPGIPKDTMAQFFINLAGNLSVYVLLLVGLQVNASQQKPGV